MTKCLKGRSSGWGFIVTSPYFVMPLLFFAVIDLYDGCRLFLSCNEHVCCHHFGVLQPNKGITDLNNDIHEGYRPGGTHEPAVM